MYHESVRDCLRALERLLVSDCSAGNKENTRPAGLPSGYRGQLVYPDWWAPASEIIVKSTRDSWTQTQSNNTLSSVQNNTLDNNTSFVKSGKTSTISPVESNTRTQNISPSKTTLAKPSPKTTLAEPSPVKNKRPVGIHYHIPFHDNITSKVKGMRTRANSSKKKPTVKVLEKHSKSHTIKHSTTNTATTTTQNRMSEANVSINKSLVSIARKFLDGEFTKTYLE